MYDSLDTQNQNAYFQMILHPVLAGKTVVELYIKASPNPWRHRQRRTSTDKLANEVRRLFAEDAEITKRFHTFNGGKWDPILQQVHIGYDNWDDPSANRMPNVSYHTEGNVSKSGIMGVRATAKAPPGDPEPTLLSMDPYMPPTEKRYFDIFTRKNGTFSFHVTSNVSYVTVTNTSGTLTTPSGLTDLRNYINIDWAKTPASLSWAGLKVEPISAEGSWNITAKLPVNKISVPTSFKGYVESGGLVSIEAEHFANSETKNGLSYIKLPHFGCTLSGIKLGQ